MELKIHYMSGAGNLFSVIDNRLYGFDVNSLKSLAPLLCTENEINKFVTEGLIALEESENQNFEAKFFNPDGSYGAMCGNGGRCAVHFAKELNLISGDEAVQFKMAGDIYKGIVNNDNTIAITFPPQKKIDLNLTVELENVSLNAAYVDIGSDHAIINFNDLNLKDDFRQFDIEKYGKSVRFNKVFHPNGANANFYLIENGVVNLRTYERGVEAETGACGTGAISTALVCHLRYGLHFPIKIIPPSRRPLLVDVIFKGDEIKNIILTGDADVIESKTIQIPDTYFEANYD